VPGAMQPNAMHLNDVIDLSVPRGASTALYPGDPAVVLRPHATIERDGYNLLELSLGSQSGTHVDAPFHFLESGARVDELPLERFAGPAVIVDARGAGERGRIGWHHI